jgi:FKBP-type peptidyl-prolyl cis-trans isomerase FkpA
VRRSRFIALLALPLMLGACNDSPTQPPIDLTTVSYAPALGVSLSNSTKLPSGMYYRTLGNVGTGAIVTTGQTLGVKYTGWLANGSQFDSNQSSTSVFSFKLGAGAVIAGWEQGIPGMRVGETRQLVIPPALAYGATGSGSIPGNAVLVFQVQVVSAQ